MKYTIREVVAKTGVSSETIRDKIKNGTIQASMQGNKYLIDETELAKLPKPYNTSVNEQVQKVEVPQGSPFPLEMIAKQLTEGHKAYIQAMLTLTPAS